MSLKKTALALAVTAASTMSFASSDYAFNTDGCYKGPEEYAGGVSEKIPSEASNCWLTPTFEAVTSEAPAGDKLKVVVDEFHEYNESWNPEYGTSGTGLIPNLDIPTKLAPLEDPIYEAMNGFGSGGIPGLEDENGDGETDRNDIAFAIDRDYGNGDGELNADDFGLPGDGGIPGLEDENGDGETDHNDIAFAIDRDYGNGDGELNADDFGMPDMGEASPIVFMEEKDASLIGIANDGHGGLIGLGNTGDADLIGIGNAGDAPIALFSGAPTNGINQEGQLVVEGEAVDLMSQEAVEEAYMATLEPVVYPVARPVVKGGLDAIGMLDQTGMMDTNEDGVFDGNDVVAAFGEAGIELNQPTEDLLLGKDGEVDEPGVFESIVGVFEGIGDGFPGNGGGFPGGGDYDEVSDGNIPVLGAWNAVCSLVAPAVDFGNLDLGSASEELFNKETTITVDCTGGTGYTLTVDSSTKSNSDLGEGFTDTAVTLYQSETKKFGNSITEKITVSDANNESGQQEHVITAKLRKASDNTALPLEVGLIAASYELTIAF